MTPRARLTIPAQRARQKNQAKALGVPRCKECGEPVKKAERGLTNREAAARAEGFCTLRCKEEERDGE